MRRLLPALAIPVLVGVPLWHAMSWPVIVLAMAGAGCGLVAALRASPSLATVGGTLALLSLALALRMSSAPADMLTMAVFGSALLLLVEATHWCRRLDGASITPALWRRTIAWWTGRTALSLLIALVIAILAPLIALSLPSSWGAFVAGLGILAAVAAAVAAAWPAADD